MKNKQLIEGEHFTYNEQGWMVLTTKYHLENGTCCGNGCLNCPYDHINVPEPKRSKLINRLSDEAVIAK
jgi:hypothetical protein